MLSQKSDDEPNIAVKTQSNNTPNGSYSSASTRLGSLHHTIQLQSMYQSFVQYHP